MKVVIFGGSGFLGRSIVNCLLLQGCDIKVVCQNKSKAQKILPHTVEISTFNIFDVNALLSETKGYDVAINCIGKLFEKNSGDFQKFHSEFPKILSQNFDGHIVHISACGIKKSSQVSKYAETKLIGEQDVEKYAKSYNIISPSVIFGKDDNFFNQFAKISKISPFLPLIGGGKTLFQPVWVEDVAKAVTYCCNKQESGKHYVACGDVMSFKEILEFVCKTRNVKRAFIVLPFSMAKLQAKIMNFFRIFTLTEDQVELLKFDNTCDITTDFNIYLIVGQLATVESIAPSYIK